MTHRHVTARPGESRPFHFETPWQAPASPARTWQVLSDIPAWPTWWPGITSARTLQTREHARLAVQNPLGHHLQLDLTLVAEHPPFSARFTVAGDLRGTGTVALRPTGENTRVTITWCVVTRRRLIRALRPLAAPSHAAVMAAGQRGLRRILT